jgi:CRISPR-associated endoribonuclease Cas6
LRIRLIFILKNKGGYVPFHHQYLLTQLIKGILLKGGKEEYFSYTGYNFSGLKGQTKISRNGLHFFSSRVTLVISCMNKDFIDYFVKNVFDFPQLEVGNLTLIPEMVEEEQMVEFENVNKFICISPIVLTSPKFNDSEGKKFIHPETDEFSDLLYESTILRMNQSKLFTPEQLKTFFKFQLVPDHSYLMKIEQSQKKFARIYPVFDQDVKYEVRGYTFPFTLYAAPEVQKFVFILGLGAFTHKGFGMLDLANIDPTQRTKEYKVENYI